MREQQTAVRRSGDGSVPADEQEQQQQSDGDAEEERALVARTLAGDTEAFARLCERHRRRVWRIVASVVRGSGSSKAANGAADMDDLAQEAIVRAFCALHTYRAEAPFGSWLCRIALNVAHDYQRSAWKRRVTLWPQNWLGSGSDGPPPGGGSESAAALAAAVAATATHGGGETPEAAFARRDTQRRVREAVAALPTRERVPIWLVYFEGFTLAEVARLEGVPESTLRSRTQAGLRRLGTALSDLIAPMAPAAGAAGAPSSPNKNTVPGSAAALASAGKGRSPRSAPACLPPAPLTAVTVTVLNVKGCK